MNNDDSLSVYVAEITRRGGETTIRTGSKGRSEEYLHISHQADGYTLLRADAWRYYSSRFPMRRASLVYLCGRDDNGLWAVRVPSTITNIFDALTWIEPSAVKRARTRGKRVLRQGDIYLVESRSDDFSALENTSHRWDNNARLVVHTGGHQQTEVPFRARAVVQSVMRMGRQGQFRRHGD